jgi:hypothetical protein
MTPAELIDLLREARKLIHTTLDINALHEWACESDGDELALDDLMYSLRGRIDAALAAHQDEVPAQDSAKSEMESADLWWEDKLFRAVFGSAHLIVQAKGPHSWFWSVSFTDRKDKHGLHQGQYGTATTEAEAKSAAHAVARGLR